MFMIIRTDVGLIFTINKYLPGWSALEQMSFDKFLTAEVHDGLEKFGRDSKPGDVFKAAHLTVIRLGQIFVPEVGAL